MTVSVEMLHRLLVCDPEAGRLFWKTRTADLFRDTAGRTAAHACANWNARYAGGEAFTAPNGNGYRFGQIFNRPYLAHRVIWAMQYGAWPDHEIDHVNGDRADNRLANLRDVCRADNCRNMSVKPGQSGAPGVHAGHGGKWAARIGVDGRVLHLGYFESVEDARAARKAAEALHGYHPNHGRAV